MVIFVEVNLYRTYFEFSFKLRSVASGNAGVGGGGKLCIVQENIQRICGRNKRN